MLEEESDVLVHIQYLAMMASVMSVNCSLSIPILTEPVYEQLALQYIKTILVSCVGERDWTEG